MVRVPTTDRGRPLPMRVPGHAPGLENTASPLAESLARRAVLTCNDLFAGGATSGSDGSFDTCHSNAYSRVLENAGHMANSFDASMSDAASFASIGGGMDYRGASTSFVALDETRLALPPVGSEPISLCDLLGPSEKRSSPEIPHF